MKTNMELHQDVLAELTWDPRIREKEIGVAVKDGVVTLTGTVGSYAEWWTTERAVEEIAGVKAVANDLVVELPDAAVCNDTELAHRVTQALHWDVEVPADKITARVSNGWVTLDGEVSWAFQREAALRAVRPLLGVRGVSDAIRIVPTTVSSYDVAQQIKQALRRRADREAEQIVVVAKDHEVTLRGRVPSFADRRAIEGAAWTAPGVKKVLDEIVVSI